MKKKSGLERAVPKMSLADLEALNTKTLIARLKRLRFCEEAPEQSDLSDEEISSVTDVILFKSDPDWKLAYSDLKRILGSREHIEN